MGVAGLIIGIFTFLGFLIGFIPLLGWFNWFNIPLAFVGLILSVVGLTSDNQSKGAATGGTILCGIAVFVGLFRLIIGGGIL